MQDCELLGGCIFFSGKMEGMPSTAELIKLRYCKEDSKNCARYMVCKALGRDRVPADLFPNHGERAKQLIAGK